MCGRFVVSYTYQELLEFLGGAFDIFDLDVDVNLPKYNIGPGQKVISIISDGEKYRAGTLKWGLVPSWAKDEKIGYKMINARSETITEKPSYKSLFRNKRCLILADGFYEWKKTETKKQPMYIQTKDRQMFLFAGLWSSYQKPDGTKLYTTTIITTSANEMMSDIHDRMPVILDLEQAKVWLDMNIKDRSVLQSLLQPYDSTKMTYHPVSTLVNKVENDVPQCIQPISDSKQEEGFV